MMSSRVEPVFPVFRGGKVQNLYDDDAADDNESNWTLRETCDLRTVMLGRWCEERSPDS